MGIISFDLVENLIEKIYIWKSTSTNFESKNNYGIHKLDFKTISKIYLSSKSEKVDKLISVTSKIDLHDLSTPLDPRG